jgi:hypothetical protein
MKTWYGSADTSHTIIEHYRMALQELQLDENIFTKIIMNGFIICCQKLELKYEEDMVEAKRHTFLEKEADDDYDVVHQALKGDSMNTFEQSF